MSLSNPNSKKPVNYIYNKQMLRKIQILKSGEKSNEMEIKNYAEELDSIQRDITDKKLKIQKRKCNVIEDIIFSNQEYPNSWKRQMNNTKTVIESLCQSKDLVSYLSQNELNKESGLSKSKQTFNSVYSINKENQREIKIARFFNEYRQIKRQIEGIINKNYNDLSIKHHNSVITEKFIDLKPFLSNLKTESIDTDRLMPLMNKKSTSNIVPVKSNPVVLEAINRKIKIQKEESKLELIKLKLNKRKGSTLINIDENDQEDHLQTEEDEMIKSEITDNGVGSLLKKLNTNLVSISNLGLRNSLTIKESEFLKSINERAKLIKNTISKSHEGLLLSDEDKNQHTLTQPDTYSGFIKSKENKFKGEFKIKDKLIRDKIYELSDYKHYGPYASYCKGCNLKNVNFYNNLDARKGVDILDYLLKHKD